MNYPHVKGREKDLYCLFVYNLACQSLLLFFEPQQHQRRQQTLHHHVFQPHRCQLHKFLILLSST